MNEWVVAGIAVAMGIAVGALAGWIARRFIRGRQSDLNELARLTATFLFWFFTAAGVVVAVGVVAPGSFDTVPQQILGYLPNVLIAGLIMLGSWALAAVLGRVLRRGVASAAGGGGNAIAVGVRAFILSVGFVFALAQLGVDTTVLTILVAGLVSFGALSGALLVGLGGRQIASELAAGRYLRRHIRLGEVVSWDGGTGAIAELHPAFAEIESSDGSKELVPYTTLVKAGFVKKS